MARDLVYLVGGKQSVRVLNPRHTQLSHPATVAVGQIGLQGLDGNGHFVFSLAVRQEAINIALKDVHFEERLL